jgi:hypothetical protein
MRTNSARGLMAVFAIPTILSGILVLAPRTSAQEDNEADIAELTDVEEDGRVVQAKGAWKPRVAYNKDDLVTSRGSAWRSKHDNNRGNVPGSTNPPSGRHWELFAGGFNPLGPWLGSRTYHKNDLVTHLGETWRAKRTSKNKTPRAGADWQKFAAAGEDGVQGPQGIQGPPGPSNVGDGTQAAPSFRFTDDPDTGIFSPSAGKIALVEDGQLFLHNKGNDNAALGLQALSSNTTGGTNTAVGSLALASNTTGSGNTALGFRAMANNLPGSNNTAVGQNTMLNNFNGSANTALGAGALAAFPGDDNTAVGFSALQNNTVAGNTAVGSFALFNNIDGVNNTAVGTNALSANDDGERNTAVGMNALANNSGNGNTAMGNGTLQSNTTGGGNTAIGDGALTSNTSSLFNVAVGSGALSTSNGGGSNTALGHTAMFDNTTGDENTAVGRFALGNNSDGNNNTAVGRSALSANTTGSDNIALGRLAGSVPTTPSNSIFIGNPGVLGDNAVIRIGVQAGGGSQTSTRIAGIHGQNVDDGSDLAVLIDNTGKLGTAASSRRYKYDIETMGDMSAVLGKLRPVTFRYKRARTDGSHPLQYGLIAEEVAEVFPALAMFNQDGSVETVKYHLLPSFLLAGYQQQQKVVAAQADKIEQQAEHIKSQAGQLAAQEQRLRALEALLPRLTKAAAVQ